MSLASLLPSRSRLEQWAVGLGTLCKAWPPTAVWSPRDGHRVQSRWLASRDLAKDRGIQHSDGLDEVPMEQELSTRVGHDATFPASRGRLRRHLRAPAGNDDRLAIAGGRHRCRQGRNRVVRAARGRRRLPGPGSADPAAGPSPVVTSSFLEKGGISHTKDPPGHVGEDRQLPEARDATVFVVRRPSRGPSHRT